MPPRQRHSWWRAPTSSGSAVGVIPYLFLTIIIAAASPFLEKEALPTVMVDAFVVRPLTSSPRHVSHLQHIRDSKKARTLFLDEERSAASLSTRLYQGWFDGNDNDSNNNDDSSNNNKKVVVEIPPELRDEIYAAEGNTPMAQNRSQRIALYVLLTLLGVTVAFFNAFLSDLRFGDGSPSADLSYYGFDWVQSNFVTGFLLTNKIGGALGLLGAGLSGTLAEVEIRSRKENAEKIWEEIQRRQSLKKQQPKGKKNKEAASSRSNNNKKKKSINKKDMSGKQKKRLSALSEVVVMMNDNDTTKEVGAVEQQPAPEKQPSEDIITAASINEEEEKEEVKEEGGGGGEGGIFGTIQNFYQKADNMAASQALLLNKELEDRGIIDKITDESGFKVIGKEAASKLSSEKETTTTTAGTTVAKEETEKEKKV